MPLTKTSPCSSFPPPSFVSFAFSIIPSSMLSAKRLIDSVQLADSSPHSYLPLSSGTWNDSPRRASLTSIGTNIHRSPGQTLPRCFPFVSLSHSICHGCFFQTTVSCAPTFLVPLSTPILGQFIDSTAQCRSVHCIASCPHMHVQAIVLPSALCSPWRGPWLHCARIKSQVGRGKLDIFENVGYMVDSLTTDTLTGVFRT